MPFRPGIISSGEDFVNETAGLNRQMREKMKKVPVLFEYEDEDHLLDHAKQIRQKDEDEKRHAAERRAYLLFWAKEKSKELQACSARGHTDICTQCGCCLCDGNKFRCLCEGGKRMLSPYRIAWLNSRERELWRTQIWQVGVGYVPRQRFETASPKSEDLRW